jgi:cellulose biosynthesis protein BcsQ
MIERIDVALAKALEPALLRLDKSYDVILFDCAAGTGALSLAAVRLSRVVISPSVLDSVSLGALQDFIRIIIRQDLALTGQLAHYMLPALFRTADPEQHQKLDHIRAGTIKLKTITRPVPDTVHIRRATERIRPESFRTLREKYAGALPELEALARSVAAIIKTEGTKP